MSPRVRSIIADVAREHQISVEELCSPARHRRLAHPRFDAMARIRALQGPRGGPLFSLPQIGEMLGGRDHTTVMHGLRKAAELYGPRSPIYPIQDTDETRL